jgi:hypothetical protein
MLEQPEQRSFADDQTEFFLPEMPTHAAGHYKGEPTGVVICLACLESHKNIDQIPHSSTCPQRFVHSRWWVRNHEEVSHVE